MPAISELCKNKDDSLRPVLDRYEESYNQVAKIALLVPSSTRGTDKHEVDGKWHETQTIFARTTATYDCVFNNFDLNSYWSEQAQYAFGETIRSLITAGMAQEISSAHMQNLYFAKKATEFVSAPADFATMLYQFHFTEDQWELMILNNLVGWKNAECFAPSYPVDEYRPAAVSGFFQGLMQEDHHPVIQDLFRILPIPLTLAIVRLVSQKNSNFQYSGRLLEELLSFLPYHPEILTCFKECLETYKKKSQDLFGSISANRSKFLIEVLSNGLRGVNSENYNALCALAKLTQAAADSVPEGLLLYRLLGVYVELLFGETGCCRDHELHGIIQQIELVPPQEVMNVCNHTALKSRELFIKEIINLTNLDERVDYVTRRIEEAIYSNHRRLRKWVIKLLNIDDKSRVIKWIDEIKTLMEPWFEKPEDFIESYLSFMFKKDEILNFLYRESCQNTISYLLGPWDGISPPYVRRYPQFSLKHTSTISSNAELDVEKLRGLGDLWITFYIDGYDV